MRILPILMLMSAIAAKAAEVLPESYQCKGFDGGGMTSTYKVSISSTTSGVIEIDQSNIHSGQRSVNTYEDSEVASSDEGVKITALFKAVEIKLPPLSAQKTEKFPGTISYSRTDGLEPKPIHIVCSKARVPAKVLECVYSGSYGSHAMKYALSSNDADLNLGEVFGNDALHFGASVSQGKLTKVSIDEMTSYASAKSELSPGEEVGQELSASLSASGKRHTLKCKMTN